MSNVPPLWSPPDVSASQPGGPVAGVHYSASIALGGNSPQAAPAKPRSDLRDLILATMLLVASVITALASLLSWRDYGRGLNPAESGWRMADGSFGRGWVAIVVAVILAVAGTLLVIGRRSRGRLWARIGSIGLVLLAVGEWAFGDLGTRSGPGLGLWVLLVMGTVLTVAIGTILPSEDRQKP